jgi:hypothetical protein
MYRGLMMGMSDLFDHIAAQSLVKTNDFEPQGLLSNLVRAYAKPALFEAIGDQVVSFKHLIEFKQQELKDSVWAYATAGISYLKLFEKVANHIIGLDSLDKFSSNNGICGKWFNILNCSSQQEYLRELLGMTNDKSI